MVVAGEEPVSRRAAPDPASEITLERDDPLLAALSVDQEGPARQILDQVTGMHSGDLAAP